MTAGGLVKTVFQPSVPSDFLFSLFSFFLFPFLFARVGAVTVLLQKEAHDKDKLSV